MKFLLFLAAAIMVVSARNWDHYGDHYDYDTTTAEGTEAPYDPYYDTTPAETTDAPYEGYPWVTGTPADDPTTAANDPATTAEYESATTNSLTTGYDGPSSTTENHDEDYTEEASTTTAYSTYPAQSLELESFLQPFYQLLHSLFQNQQTEAFLRTVLSFLDVFIHQLITPPPPAQPSPFASLINFLMTPLPQAGHAPAPLAGPNPFGSFAELLMSPPYAPANYYSDPAPTYYSAPAPAPAPAHAPAPAPAPVTGPVPAYYYTTA